MSRTAKAIPPRPDFEAADLDPARIGSSFASWLAEQGIEEEVREAAAKELFAEQLVKAMQGRKISKTALAAALGTSRNQVARILDPECDAVTLGALKKAAAAVGKRVRVELVDDGDAAFACPPGPAP